MKLHEFDWSIRMWFKCFFAWIVLPIVLILWIFPYLKYHLIPNFKRLNTPGDDPFDSVKENSLNQ